MTGPIVDFEAFSATESCLAFDDGVALRGIESRAGPGRRALTPIIRWAGSKTRLLPALRDLIPATAKRHLEPFLGSATVYLASAPREGIGSDINADLMQAYVMVQADPCGVWNALCKIPATPECYYQLRAANWAHRDPIHRAARFLYLNRFCFNGVYRTNRQGQFNVARGVGRLRIPTLEEMEAFSKLIKPVQLHCCDFEETISAAGSGDFLYLDPPYIDPDKRDRGEYGVGVFGCADLIRLIEAMRAADRRGAHVLMSYSARCINRRLLKGWRLRQVQVRRGVASFTACRTTVGELLISNY